MRYCDAAHGCPTHPCIPTPQGCSSVSAWHFSCHSDIFKQEMSTSLLWIDSQHVMLYPNARGCFFLVCYGSGDRCFYVFYIYIYYLLSLIPSLGLKLLFFLKAANCTFNNSSFTLNSDLVVSLFLSVLDTLPPRMGPQARLQRITGNRRLSALQHSSYEHAV